MDVGPVNAEPVVKRKRVTKACDFCHRRARKCRTADRPTRAGSDAEHALPTCITCFEHGVKCTWNRVPRKRGIKARSAVAHHRQSQEDQRVQRGLASIHSRASCEERVGSQELLSLLIDIYFDTIYPIFPFFDEEVFRQEWQTGEGPKKQSQFQLLMSVCSLSACHIQDGAIFTEPTVQRQDIDPDALLAEAISNMPLQFESDDAFDYMRSCGILSLVAIQRADPAMLQRYMGLYHTLMAQEGFHDESRWPRTITPAECQIRRQFFWSMYRLEVHSALVMGHVVRCPEKQCRVLYPISRPPSPGQDGVRPQEWLEGWNYITNLYRVLEHIVVQYRTGRATNIESSGQTQIEYTIDSAGIRRLLDQVLKLRSELPDAFNRASRPSGDILKNRQGFQVANIICTIQLVRMVAFTTEDITLDEACKTALELIDEISTVPVEYLRAIGSPMIQELSGVGHMLSSFIGRPLPMQEYYQLGDTLNTMAELLESLGVCLKAASDASKRLYQHVERIDAHLRKTMPTLQVPAMQVERQSLPVHHPGGDKSYIPASWMENPRFFSPLFSLPSDSLVAFDENITLNSPECVSQ